MEIKVPEIGESIVEAIVGQWQKKNGDQVAIDDLLVELETDKINIEILAESAGTLEILVTEGDTVAIGAPLGRINEGAAAMPQEKVVAKVAKPSVVSSPVATAKGSPPADARPINPAVPKIAAEKGLDPDQIVGSGRDGRLLVDDLKITPQPERPSPLPQTAPDPRPVATVVPAPITKSATKTKDDPRSRRVAMSPIRKKIAEHLLAARQQTAMLTTFNEVNMKRLLDLRTTHKESFTKKHGVKLGLMSFFVKASIEALKEFEAVNGRIDGNDIVYQDFYDIGIAVGGKRGLVVPILRDANNMSFAEIETQIRDFGERAGTGKLALEEIQGGTFTISNGGVYGSLLSTPILNPPQSAVLGMHATQDRPVVINGEIVIRPMMNLALSYDHRIIDGREAVSFLKRIKALLEDPEEMLLEM
ncbi:2-oxoglutarate dehydrogenase complex dihydrolipoyllysine-residue succinyltransferase [Geopsychrobacter electrodiphilus]|uniref:2-oxoglutarate dehydrogenase complex dihydrolipoyllysine-residue succinyltransferase n=1 Tax=Geopsychrobacter electrodiphilus TaxID=225196 RepID=UPI00037A9F0C|nr:2-oxoglutarate dehydrogenase complex dihydrolipoyllysine-residue succinyltransferase [Geopsychrobacter electrodiphilus]